MKLGYLTLLAGLLSVAAADPLDSLTEFENDDLTLEERAAGCARGVHVVAVGGQGATRGNLGYLQSLADRIRGSIPGSDLYQVAYPPDQANGGAAVAYGVPALHNHLGAYTSRCPRGRVVVIGYSIGGAVVMDTLCGAAEDGSDPLPARRNKQIVANVVYGDLTRIPGVSYDRGTCTAGSGDVPRQKPGACAPFGKKIASYCDFNDPECCGGNDPNVHFSYPGKYDVAATNYVKRKLKQFRRNRNN